MYQKTYHINVIWESEAEVWVAESENGVIDYEQIGFSVRGL